MILNIKRKENEKRKRNRETRWMKYLISSLIIILLLLFTMGCKGVKHVLQIEEPTDHTQGDDGGKLKYIVIWGEINQKE